MAWVSSRANPNMSTTFDFMLSQKQTLKYWPFHTCFHISATPGQVPRWPSRAPLLLFQTLGAAQNHLQELVHGPFPGRAANHHQTLPRRESRVNVKSTQLISQVTSERFHSGAWERQGSFIRMLHHGLGPLPSLFYEPLLYKIPQREKEKQQTVPNTSSDGQAQHWLLTRCYIQSFKRETFLKGRRTKVFLVSFLFEHTLNTHKKMEVHSTRKHLSFPEFKFKGKGSKE